MIKKYIAFERDFLMNRIQFILSFDLLLRQLSCNFLLSSDCLHCLKTSTNLFNSIILSNISHESTSVIVMFIVMLEFAPKKKDLYFRIVNIKLSSINNVEKVDRYKLEKLLNRRITSRDSKNRKKKIV